LDGFELMEINVLFLGEVSRYAHSQGDQLSIPEDSMVSDLFGHVQVKFPDLSPIAKFLFISVNGNLVPRHHLLLPGDEVAFFFRSGGG
jgi:hypothetical protein